MTNGEPNAFRPEPDSVDSSADAPEMRLGPSAKSLAIVLFILGIGATAVVTTGVVTVLYFVKVAQTARQEREAEELRKRQVAQKVMEEAAAKRRERESLREQQKAAFERKAEEQRQAQLAEQQRIREQMLAERERSERKRREKQESRLAEQLLEQRQTAERRAKLILRSEMESRMEQIHHALFRNLPKASPNSHLIPTKSMQAEPEVGSGLSWRVHLLPHLRMTSLYQKFHLNEAWDSPHNKQLIDQIPNVYQSRLEGGRTRFRTLLQLDGPKPLRVGDVTDGLAQTGAFYLVDESLAIPWTQPDSDPRASKLVVSTWLPLEDQPILFSLLGHSRPLTMPAPKVELLEAIASPHGGEVLDERLFGQNGWSDLNVLVWKGAGTADKPIEQGDVKQVALQKLTKISQALNQHVANLRKLGVSDVLRGSKLSWRVHLLPYLGERELYAKFHLQEPWYSANNAALIAKMPEVYRQETAEGWTRFRMVLPKDVRSGPGGIPDPNRITDDPSLTALVFQSAPQNSVVWTRPDELKLPWSNLFVGLGWSAGERLLAASFGGRALELPPGLHSSVLRALFSVDGGEVFDLEQALQEPSRVLRTIAEILPPMPIQGLVTLPDVPLPEDPSPVPGVSEATVLRKVARALYSFDGAFKRSPRQLTRSDGTRTQLSWRVHVLPFMGQRALYERFHLDEPWDSAHNRELIPLMPHVFRTGAVEGHRTGIQIFTGAHSLLDGARRWLSGPDSFESTVMLMLAPAEKAVVWTQPDDNPVQDSMSCKDWVGGEDYLVVVMGGLSITALHRSLPDDAFRALITRDGNELIDLGTVQRWVAHRAGHLFVSEEQRVEWELKQLKHIVLAMLNYESAYKVFPPGRRFRNEQGIPPETYMLSWRVHVLPYLGHRRLYSQFRLKEPWDSPHNLQLLPTMPDVFREIDGPVGSTYTRMMVFTGPDTPFVETGQAMATRDVTDGTQNTICVFRGPDSHKVPWTQPQDYRVDWQAGDVWLRNLLESTGMPIAMFDGAVHRLPPDTATDGLKALITPRGGEVFQLRR